MKIRSINHLLYILPLFFVITFMSCGDIRQDLYLNADGSGTLEASIDVGELMNMAQGFEDMGSDQDTITDDFMPDTIVTPNAAPKDAMTLLMEKITDPTHNQGESLQVILHQIYKNVSGVLQNSKKLFLKQAQHNLDQDGHGWL